MPNGQQMSATSNAAGDGDLARRWLAVIVPALLIIGLLGMHALWGGSPSAHASTNVTVDAGPSIQHDHSAAEAAATAPVSPPSLTQAGVEWDCAGCAGLGGHDVALMCIAALIFIVLLAARALPRKLRIGPPLTSPIDVRHSLRARLRPFPPDLTALSISRT